MKDGKRPEPKRWGSVSNLKYIITAEVDQEAYDWLSRNAAGQGLTIRRWVGDKLILGKAFEELEQVYRDGEST